MFQLVSTLNSGHHQDMTQNLATYMEPKSVVGDQVYFVISNSFLFQFLYMLQGLVS
jgi:hypothetical protein